MVIKSKDEMKRRGIEFDLTGPQGNAFYLLAVAEDLCEQLKLDTSDVITRMKASDYENLIKVFDEEFGKFVTLYR